MNKFDLFWKGVDESGLREPVHVFGRWGSFQVDNADMILQVSKIEDISPALLALTWMNESSFRFYMEANQNGKPGDFAAWDVGPMQMNVYYLKENLKVKYLALKDLNLDLITGQPTSLFSGDPLQNLRMGARMLKRIGKEDRERAIRYTGPKARPYREKSFDEHYPLFERFFKIYDNDQQRNSS